MNPDPIKIGFVFLGAACTSLGFGASLITIAWTGFRNAAYPLTKSVQLRGTLARIAAIVVGAFGLLACVCGLVTLWFGFFRVKQLLS